MSTECNSLRLGFIPKAARDPRGVRRWSDHQWTGVVCSFETVEKRIGILRRVCRLLH